MSAQLVTVATFGTPTEASIVRNRLEAVGIRTFLADEATVGMAWHLGVAVGGVKLQVAEDDAERALAELESHEPTPITDEEWRTEGAEDDADSQTDEPEVESDSEENQIKSPSDEMADRAFDAAVIGLYLLPFQLYSLWLLGRIALGTVPLTPRNRRRVLLTLVLDCLVIILILAVVWSMFSE
jgi:hypothetical protein